MVTTSSMDLLASQMHQVCIVSQRGSCNICGVLSFNYIKGDEPRWQAVNKVYHATNKTALASAENSETLIVFEDDGSWKSGCCSLFSCKLWHDRHGEVVKSPSTHGGRPDISPYASNHVVISSTDVLQHPTDYLLPIMRYDNPAADPDKSHQSVGGRTYLALVYIRSQDVELGLLTPAECNYVEAWKLEKHPFVKLDDKGLRYRVIHDVWWIILTTYEVPIGDSAVWELNMGGVKVEKKPRNISNSVTRKLARNLSAFNHWTQAVVTWWGKQTVSMISPFVWRISPKDSFVLHVIKYPPQIYVSWFQMIGMDAVQLLICTGP